MKQFKYYLVFMLILLFVSQVYAAGSEPDTEKNGRAIASSNWSVRVKPSVAEKGFDKNSVVRFIELLVDAYNVGKAHKENDIIEVNVKVLDDADVRNFSRRPHEKGLTRNVEEFKWLDVDKDGVYELLASMDYSSRPLYNGFYIIKQKKSAYTLQEIFISKFEKLDNMRLLQKS